MSFKILTLNNIAVEGLRHLPRELYEVASEIGHPDGVLVRSANMHEMDIPESVKASVFLGLLVSRRISESPRSLRICSLSRMVFCGPCTDGGVIRPVS